MRARNKVLKALNKLIGVSRGWGRGTHGFMEGAQDVQGVHPAQGFRSRLPGVWADSGSGCWNLCDQTFGGMWFVTSRGSECVDPGATGLDRASPGSCRKVFDLFEPRMTFFDADGRVVAWRLTRSGHVSRGGNVGNA
jgi:hypothetical protein